MQKCIAKLPDINHFNCNRKPLHSEFLRFFIWIVKMLINMVRFERNLKNIKCLARENKRKMSENQLIYHEFEKNRLMIFLIP